MKFRVSPTGHCWSPDLAPGYEPTIAAYNADRQVIAIKSVKPLVHNGVAVPDVLETRYQVYRVLDVTDKDLVTVEDDPILEFRQKPTGVQFGPTV